MTLATEIASTTRKLSLLVGLSPFGFTSAGGNVLGVRVSKSFDSPVPVATITVDTIHSTIQRGDRVIIDAGYNGLRQRIFTGWVIDRAYGIESSDINCAGQMYLLSRINDLTERDVDGLNVKTAIDSLFTAAGAPGAFVGVNTADVPTTFTLGTPTGLAAILPPGSFMGMLQTLMDLEGCMIFEVGGGEIYVRVLNGLPVASTGAGLKTYTIGTEATARIIGASSREDPDYTRTRIHATGATLPDGTQLVSTASLVNDNLVRPPFSVSPTYVDMEWSNHLADTQAKLDECALRELGKYARVPRQLPLEIPGDPQIEMGDTVFVKTNWTNNAWFVHGIEHVIVAEGGYATNLDLRGGDEFGGEISRNPIASFTWDVEREVFGTQVYAFLHVDAAGSSSPGGNTPLTYAWAGNQDAADDPAIDSQTGSEFVVRLDPAGMAGDVDNIIVTLTVTDADGLTASVSQTIPINASSALVRIPAVFAALDNNFSATPDGGQNWNDDPTNATAVTTVAAAPPDGVHSGIAVFGRTDGKIYRTTDYCASDLTLVLTATDQIVDIAWDPDDATTVWALTAICNLYVSLDYGATWTLIVNWRTAMSLSTIIGKRVAVENDGVVWVYGGTGVTNNGRPFIGCFVNGQTPFGFASVFGGELQTDLGSGTTALAIVDAANLHDGGGLTIILENYNASDSGVRPIYHCANPFAPTGWQRATGLTAGLTTAGVYVVPDEPPGTFHAAFANRDVWTSTNGVAWTQAANVMPVGVTPNRCIWLREDAEGLRTTGTYLVAAENAGATLGIYKSYDSLATVGVFRPATGFATWPASAEGKDVAVGPSIANPARVLVAADPSGTNDFAAWRIGGDAFTNKTFTNAQANAYSKARPITNLIWFLFYWGNDSTQLDTGVCYRTVDAGATWDEPYAVPAVGRVWQDIQRDAGGRLWGLSIETGNTDHMEIWYNDDPEGDGAWTESKDNDAATSKFPVHIACHPTNLNIIAVWARTGAANQDFTIWYTTDRGANWSSNTVAGISTGTMVQAVGFKMISANNRLVVTHLNLSDGDGEILTSDNYGATWTSRKVFADVDSSAEYVNGVAGDGITGRLFVSIMYSPSAGVSTLEVWRSVNSGETWELIAADSLGNGPPQVAASMHYDGGPAYDRVADALYLFGHKDTGNVNGVVRLQPADATGAWEDLTDSVGSYGLVLRSPYSVAVVPA